MNLIEAIKKYGKTRRLVWIKGVYAEIYDEYLYVFFKNQLGHIELFRFESGINDLLAEDWVAYE